MIADNPELAEELESLIIEALKSQGNKQGTKKNAVKETSVEDTKAAGGDDDELDGLNFDEDLPDDFSIDEDK